MAGLTGCPSSGASLLVVDTRDAASETDDASMFERDATGDAGNRSGVDLGACFYSALDWAGDAWCVPLSDFTSDVVTLSNLAEPGRSFQHRIRSVRVFGRARLILFSEDYGQGASSMLEAGSFAALPSALGGVVSSFELRDVNECEDGTAHCARGEICRNIVGAHRCDASRVCFFSAPDFIGESTCFDPEEGTHAIPSHLLGRVSSVRITGALLVTLEGQVHGVRARRALRRSESDLRDGDRGALADAADRFTIAVSSIDDVPPPARCVAPPRPVMTGRLALERMYAVDWVGPTAGVFSPTAPDRLYMAEKVGVVAYADRQSATKRVALDLRGRVYAGLDAGIVGIAFSPIFATDGNLFLVYNIPCDRGPSGRNPVCPDPNTGFVSRVASFHSNDGGATFDLASERVLLDSWNAVDNHTVDTVVFGPDNMLYISTGDGGNGCGTCQINGQNPRSLRGKILRIDPMRRPRASDGSLEPGCVDGPSASYCVPSDNPFVDGVRAAPEIFATGLRNPWKMTFDALGRLWAGDVGQDSYEEIDRIEAGANYGWASMEGPSCFLDRASGGPPCNSPLLRMPVAWYDHNTGGNSVTGGYVYRGHVESLRGAYVFADFVRHKVWALWSDGTQHGSDDPNLETAPGFTDELLFTTDSLIEGTSLFVPAFLEDSAGELYVVVTGSEWTFNGSRGQVYKIVEPSDAYEDVHFPTKLSATGCFLRNPVTGAFSDPTPELLPYSLNAPFWSDGAEKRRFLSLPRAQGSEVRTPARMRVDGDIEFPRGTVLWKEFQLAGRRVETRLFVHHLDGVWAGYSYRWGADQVDADLITRPSGDEIPWGAVAWRYPSGAECLRCHGEATRRALGPEVRQLDRIVSLAPGRPAGQLATLAYLGWLEATLEDDARFAFDERAGNVAANDVDASSPGTINGSARWVTASRDGAEVRALELDGTNFVETQIPNATTRTLAAFIRPTSSDVVPFIESVIDSDVPGEFGTGFGLAGGAFRVILDDQFWDTGVPVRLGVWQHVALTFDTSQARFYVDGRLAASLDYAQGVVSSSNYFVGRSHANALYFHGLIDDVRIFGWALESEEVAQVARGAEPGAPELSPPFPNPYEVRDGVSVEDRARAWLHTNCSPCHRPGGAGAGLDFRRDTALSALGVCDLPPLHGNAGITDALRPRLIAPGDPDRSVLVRRIETPDGTWRMPPISSHVVDVAGVRLVREWIASLLGCD